MSNKAHDSDHTSHDAHAARICYVLLVVTAWAAQAATVSWTGGSGDWSTPANWSTGALPGPDDDVSISPAGTSVTVTHSSGTDTVKSLVSQCAFQLTGGSLTVSNTVQVNGTFTLAGGTLVQATILQGANGASVIMNGSVNLNRVTLNGAMAWTGGSIGAGGALTIATNAVLNLAGTSTLGLYGSLTNAGTVNWTGTGDLDVYSGVNGWDGAIVNLAGGVFNAQNDQSINQSAYLAYFDNAGMFSKWPGTNTTRVGVAFNNSGTVDVKSGTVAFNGGGAGTGTFNAAAGTGISFGNGNSGTFTGAGAYSIGGGTVTLNGGVQNVTLSGGTLVGVNGTITNLTWSGGTLGGNITLTGAGTWTGGSIGAGSALTIATNAVLNLAGTSTLGLYGSLTNAGTVNWTGTGDLDVYSGVNGWDGGIVNLAGGVFNAQNDQSINQSAYAAYFDNAGWFVKWPGTNTTTVGVAFNNSGTVDAQSGTISLRGTCTLAGGTLNFGISSLANFGSISLSGNPAALAGAVSANLNNGYLPTAGNSFPVISYGSASGVFALNLPLLGTGQAWEVSYTPNTVVLQVVSSSGFTDQISGSVTDNLGHGVTNVTAYACATNGTGLYVGGVTDAYGNYGLNVTNGAWLVGLSGLLDRGYNTVPDQLALVSNANATVNFVLQLSSSQTFTITTAVNPPGAGTASGGGTFVRGSMVTVRAAPNNATLPYAFASWTESGVFQSGSGTYSFPAVRDRSLVANFSLPTFTISASNNPPSGGTVTGTGSYAYGTTNVLTAHPNFGYNFGSWTENGVIVGPTANLTTVVYANHSFVANYTEANTNHLVTTATLPPGLARVGGSGVYTNGQSGTFSAPPVVVSGQYDYFFREFALTNTVVSASASFTKVFSTTDPTNLQYVAVYASLGVTPVVTNVTVNFPNPVPATTSFQLGFRFDRSMNTNVTPQVTLTNSAREAVQPTVPAGGHWASVVVSNDTFYLPPVTFIHGMDGTVQVFIAAAQDPLGGTMGPTNVFTILVDATPPVLSNIAATPSVLSTFVTWTSDKPASSLVEYGTSPAYGLNSGFNSQLVTAHGVTLGSLNPLTTYHFRVHSSDQAGNQTISGDESFTTLAAPDLQVTNLSVTGSLVSGGNLLISWRDTNSGAGATFTYWYDQVIVTNSTTGQTLLNSSLFYDPSVNGNIAPGGAQNRHLSFQLPDGPSGAGRMQAIVTVNAYGNQYEANNSVNAQLNNTESIALVSTLAAYPDLQITGLALTNSQLRSGNVAGLVWNDANTGTGSASSQFYDQILVVNQTTAQTLVNTVLVDNAAIAPIAAGQSVPRQFSFALPDGPPGAGTLRIVITADIYDNVFEYNTSGTAKSNNTNSIVAASTLAPYPDLLATNVVVPASANAGQGISVSWTETNQGAAAATNTWYDQVFLTEADTVGGGQLLGTFAFTNGLAVDQSTTVTQSVTLPQFVQGSQWIVVKANALASFFELNTNNNSAISTRAVMIAPTLLLGLAPATISESAGANSVTGTLTRNGDISAALTVQLATATGTNLFVPASVTVPAGQSGVTFLAGPIDHFIAGSPVAEAITATAAGFAPATAPLTILEDDPTTLTLSLSAASVNDNAGPNAVSAAVARNANFGTPLTVTLMSDTPSVLILPASVTIPAGQVSAAFGLTPVPTAAIGDARKVNISAFAPGFSSVSTPIQVLNVNSLQLSLTLQNSTVSKGAGNSAGQATVSIPSALSAAQNILLTVQGSSLVTIPAVVTIPAGATAVNFSLNVGNDNLATGPQTATLLAQALTPDQVALTNGEASAQLQILDINGATLSLSLASSTISKGSNTTATVVRNTLATNALTVNLNSSPPGIVALPVSVPLPLNQTSATFTVTGILNGKQTGPESVTLTASATGFNSGAAPLTVSDIYLPDLSPASITVPTTALTSGQLIVSWVIANRGLGAATNQTWYDYVSVASDSVGQNQTLVAAVANPSGLAVGASYTNQASFYLPPTPGDYWIIVVADGGNVVSELNKQNNALVSSLPIAVNPAYGAAITNVAPAVANQGTPITLSGWTYNPANQQPAPNSAAVVNVQINGTQRFYPVASDSTGSFSYTFQPLANEAGDYTAGADYPYTSPLSAQASFVLLGMQALPATLTAQVLPNVPLAGQLILSNLTDQALSGLAVTLPNLQGNLTAQFTFTNSTLPAFGAVAVNYTLQSSLAQSAQINFSAIVTSSEGAQLTIPVNARVVPLVPQLIANPAYLSSGMVVGQQSTVSFDIHNTGGASSGDLAVQLPTNLTWMALASSATIPSIPTGGKAAVTLLLNPPPGLTLTLYTGNLVAFGANSGVSVPFQIRAVSESTGDLRVTATDDYTYYVAGAPNVTNATVTVRDAITTAVIAQTNSDANGIADFPTLPAGPYTVDATAAEHSQFRGSVSVVPGVTNALEAFMPRQLVSYQWTVVPTEIPDEYQIVLQSVFQTEVPVPNVVVAEPEVMLLVAPGEASQFTITLSNEGLIQAENVSISVPDDPTYLVTPLVTSVGIIPAQSTVQVPVTVQLRSAPAPGLARGNDKARPMDGGGCNLSDINACLPDIPLGVVSYHVCGNNGVPQERSIDLKLICTTKDAKDCWDNLKKLNPASNPNLVAATCNAISALLACGGLDFSPCQKAALSTACGAGLGLLEGGPAGAAAGAASAGASDLLECACSLLKNLPPPTFASSPPPPTASSGGFFGLGVSWPANGFPVITGSFIPGTDCAKGSAHVRTQVKGGSTPAFPTSLPNLGPPQKKDLSQGVCATVRLQIDQDVVMSRSAFAGTLEIEDGGSTAITAVQVSLAFQNATNGDASSMFVVEGPVLSSLTAVDGTGTLAGGATGSAVYTFIPTDDAAPYAPATYQIGGTLSYLDSGQQVTVPLLSAPFTVYPEAKLDLVYFQQRDIYGPDPLNPQLSEPSQPFDLALIVKNVGAGAAHSFQITSGQPQIVDNEKGLLINFTILGTEVGDQPISPSLTANLGDISPGASKQVTWELLSTLAGKFISFNATFQHVDDLGNTNTSLINSVEIHSLTHRVLANRPTDDDLPDFLVNDIPNPDSLPDTLYLSDGTVAPVNVVTSGSFDGPAAPGHLQVQLTTAVSNGWNYIQLPDPGVGYLLERVVRSDGEVLPMTNDAWTTSLSFPSSSTAPVAENLVHLFDWAGPGSYTLYYHSTNTTAPAIVQIGPLTPFNQPGAVSSVDIVFSEAVDTTTFSYTNLKLTLNGGPNLIASGAGISLTLVSNTTYSINGLAPFAAADGDYQLTVNGSGIYDLWANNAGNISASTQWAKGNAAPVVQSISAISPNPRNTPVPSVTVNFSKAINAATFDYHALTLTLNGGPNLITSAVSVTPQTASSFTIGGLGPLTGAQGNYVLTVNATGVQDTGGMAGFGSQSVGWGIITAGPTITALEQIATNPRNIVVQTLAVTFSEAIDPATFDYTDLTLTRDGGSNLITSAVQLDPVNATTCVITNISWVQGYAGTYTLTVSAAGVRDLAGNPGAGSTNESWRIVLGVPATPANLAIMPGVTTSPTSGLSATNNLTLIGTVGASNLTVRAFDVTTSADLGVAKVVGTNFSIYLAFTTEGLHHLQVNAIDAAGNASLAAFFDLFLDIVPPTAIIEQVANPIYSAVSSIPVTFSEAINTNTLSATNFVVTLNGANPFTPTLTYVSSNTFLLGNLAAYTLPLGTYQVTLNLSGVQDLAGNRTANLVAMSWVHGTTYRPPVIARITNVIVPPDDFVSFQVQAHDPNGAQLTYSLAPGSPTNASIGPASGLFFWAPTRAYAQTTNSFTVVATDNVTPPMSTNQTFTVIVLDYLELSLGSTNVQSGQAAGLPVYLASNDGVTDLVFTVQAPDNLLTHWTLTAIAPEIGSATVQDQKTNLLVVLQMLAGQSLQGTQLLSRLNFEAATNQMSSFVTLSISAIGGLKPTGSSYSNYLVNAGSVAVVENQPLLWGVLSANLARELVLYGRIGANYQVQYKTDLRAPEWQPWLNYTQTNGTITLGLDATNPVIFYRLLQR